MSVIKEIETRTVRHLTVEDVEQALRDQYDLHIQDDIEIKFNISGGFFHGVEIVHIERETKHVEC